MSHFPDLLYSHVCFSNGLSHSILKYAEVKPRGFEMGMHNGIVPHLYWGLYYPNIKRELCRRYGENDAARVLKASRPYFRQTLKGIENPKQGSFYYYALLRASLLASIYLGSKTLGEALAPSPEECAALFADAMHENPIISAVAHQMRTVFTLEHQARIEHNALRSNMKHAAYGWSYTYIAGSGQRDFHLTYRRCGILRLYQEMGIPELMRAACRFPAILCDIADIELEHPLCLAQGDPACRFHFTLIPEPDHLQQKLIDNEERDEARTSDMENDGETREHREDQLSAEEPVDPDTTPTDVIDT